MPFLYRHPAMERLCNYLEESKPHFNDLARRYKSHRGFDEDREFPLDFYESAFLTLFVKSSVEKIGEEHPELSIRTPPLLSRQNRWVPDNIGKYFIYPFDSYEKYLDARERGEEMDLPFHLTCYETVVLIGSDAIPTIIESSLFRFPRLQKGKSRNLHLKVEILSGETRKKPGYIIVTPEQHARPATKDGEFIKNSDLFTASGGLIARLYTTEEDFRNGVRQAAGRHGLKVKKSYKIQV